MARAPLVVMVLAGCSSGPSAEELREAIAAEVEEVSTLLAEHDTELQTALVEAENLEPGAAPCPVELPVPDPDGRLTFEFGEAPGGDLSRARANRVGARHDRLETIEDRMNSLTRTQELKATLRRAQGLSEPAPEQVVIFAERSRVEPQLLPRETPDSDFVFDAGMRSGRLYLWQKGEGVVCVGDVTATNSSEVTRRFTGRLDDVDAAEAALVTDLKHQTALAAPDALRAPAQ